MIATELIQFEEEVAKAFEAKLIHGPIHLCSPEQAEPLIQIFQEIHPQDWVLSTWRSHWHALLKGVPRERVMEEILAGRSMMLHFPDYKFLTSAIVGGILPIACGLAAARERVWCFVGDMAASIGAFHDATEYAGRHKLPITFIVEDNGLATNTPTQKAWGLNSGPADVTEYTYTRTYPHVGSGPYVAF